MEHDVLVVGPSRARNQFSPCVIDSILGTSTFNIGIDGWPFHLEDMMFRIYLQHNKKPKYIIQNIGWGMMAGRQDFYGYEQFLPFANDSLVHAFTGQLDGAFTVSERYFPLFAYNNHFDLIKTGIKSFRGVRKPNNSICRGYVPITTPWDGKFDEVKAATPELFNFVCNDTIAQEFGQYLQFCTENNIQVIFVYAPTYYEATQMMQNRQDMLRLFDGFSKKYNVPILDYSADSICYDKSLFANSQHMNYRGAALFSQKLALDLKKYIRR